MSRALITIHGAADRQRAVRAIQSCPTGTRLEFKAAKRTIPQNDRFWAMLTDIAQQKEHFGRRYTADEWKLLMMHGCGREMQFIPSLDGKGFMPMGYRSSALTKSEMSELMEFISAWGAENGVVFHDDEGERAAA